MTSHKKSFPPFKRRNFRFADLQNWGAARPRELSALLVQIDKAELCALSRERLFASDIDALLGG